MSVVVQISDPHFGTLQAPVVEALTALVRQQQPDPLLLSGDITQRARKAQFEAARAFFDGLRTPVLAVPGNHDIPPFDLWACLRAPHARFAAAFGADLAPVHRAPDLMVVCANTSRPWRHVHGAVAGAKVERVARIVEGGHAEQLRVVMVHQPVAVTLPDDHRNLLRGHADALRRGPRPAWTSLPAGTSTCPMCWRCRAWRGPCGQFRRVRRCHRGCVTGRPTRSTCCAGAGMHLPVAAGWSGGTCVPTGRPSCA